MPSSLTTLAYYLPQFHEIPENNAWWGEGFTEWTQLRQARSWSKRHVIRRPVAPLGEYCLTDAASLELQWEIAGRHGIDGFAVWDYWLGDGRQLLHKPIQIVLDQRLRFKYCLAWANHSWWDKSRGRLLCEQKYLGESDYAAYFRYASKHFESDNYVKIDGNPVFIIFEPGVIPDAEKFVEQWRKLARAQGFPDIYFVGNALQSAEPMLEHFDKYADSLNWFHPWQQSFVNRVKERLWKRHRLELGPRWIDFRGAGHDVVPAGSTEKFAPTILTGWDTTPRHGRRGVVFEHLDVSALRRQLVAALQHFERFPNSHSLLLLKSWNEWAEGNILEPDSVYGFGMLETVRDALADASAGSSLAERSSGGP